MKTSQTSPNRSFHRHLMLALLTAAALLLAACGGGQSSTETIDTDESPAAIPTDAGPESACAEGTQTCNDTLPADNAPIETIPTNTTPESGCAEGTQTCNDTLPADTCNDTLDATASPPCAPKSWSASR